jgi:hypothetical protein
LAFCSVELFYSTKRSGVICLLLHIPTHTSKIGSWLCVEGTSSFILHWTGKSMLDPVKKVMGAQTLYLAHSSTDDLFALPLYCIETPHIHTHVLLRAFFFSLCLGMATGLVETFLFRERREPD